MLAGILRQKHPEWDGKLWELLDVLYEGGFDVSSDSARLDQMLPKSANESSVNHDERKKSACYINYMGDVVDFFGAQLFTKTLTVLPGEKMPKAKLEPYEEFSEDADGKGHSLQELISKVFLSAAVTRKAIVAVDFPRNIEPAASLLEERKGKMDRPRAFLVDPSALLDWKKADDGTYEWAVLYRATCDRDSPESQRDKITYEWKVWRMVAGVARWQRFAVTKEKGDQHVPKDEDEIPLVDEDVTSFKRVPLVDFMLPKGLWIGNKIGPMVLEHFRRRTTLVTSQAKSLHAIPVIALGPEIGAAQGKMPSEAQQDPSRGSDPIGQFDQKGWVKTGADDKVYFAEPDGGAYEVEAKQIDRLVDEIFRVSHLMAQSVAATSQAMQRSGASKVEDRNATEVVLEALGDKLGKFAVRIYDTIAQAMGDDVFWVAKGLSDFRIRDRKQVVEEGKSVSSIAIPSKTFKKNYFTQIALRLLDDISPEDEQAIRLELEEAAEKEDNAPDPLNTIIRSLTPGQPGGPPQPPGPGQNAPTDPQNNGAGTNPPAPKNY